MTLTFGYDGSCTLPGDVFVVAAAPFFLERAEGELGCRSRVTRPKAQSVMSMPPVNHSSVQA